MLSGDLRDRHHRPFLERLAVLFFSALQPFGESRGFFRGVAEIKADEPERCGKEEGYAPAPI
ncbi:hypothetical protein D3C78_1322430 [compost metagenome]